MYIYIYVYLSLCKIVDKFSCITMCFLPKQDAVWSVYPCSLSMADQCIFARCYVILDLTYTRIYHATSSAKIPVLLSCWWRAMSNHVRKSFIFDSQDHSQVLWWFQKIEELKLWTKHSKYAFYSILWQILAISCDRLNVQVPWSHLRSRPVQVKVGNLRIQARLPTGKSWGVRSNNCELVVKVHLFYYSRWTHKWLCWVFSFQRSSVIIRIINHQPWSPTFFPIGFKGVSFSPPVGASVFEVRVHSSSDRSWAESVAVSAAIAKSEQKPQEWRQYTVQLVGLICDLPPWKTLSETF